jgi:hypothetical protein
MNVERTPNLTPDSRLLTMAGIKLVTDADPETALQIAWRTAQDLGFKLTPVLEGAFCASKGHMIWSMLVGPAAPHCSFRIAAFKYPDGTDLVLERNSPWTSGLLGLRRIQGEADTLMERVADAVARAGCKVIDRKEI